MEKSKEIKNPFEKYKERLGKETKKAPPHELSATVNLIEEADMFTSKYNRGYWLGKVKRANVSYGEMFSIIKDIRGMDSKYNKGGRLTNLLTLKAKALKLRKCKK